MLCIKSIWSIQMKNFGEPYGTQGGWNHIGSKWSVIITDLFKMKKKTFLRILVNHMVHGGGVSEPHWFQNGQWWPPPCRPIFFILKWSVMITDHFEPMWFWPPLVRTTLHTHTYRLMVITLSMWLRPFGTTWLKIKYCHSHPHTTYHISSIYFLHQIFVLSQIQSHFYIHTPYFWHF